MVEALANVLRPACGQTVQGSPFVEEGQAQLAAMQTVGHDSVYLIVASIAAAENQDIVAARGQDVRT